ncbi:MULTISPECIES: porin [unclassified Herbaspirillum]|uniref:porin n=1 Tax=unclassified Herbaspirillum TaxID=2624150 RepID=UPI001153B432|nr:MULTISPECIES: porin [unclassified Herbaspirillum]MBB5393179.1 putative porin [Herbaspirillum sp. SJZ102]TQK04180.1 putative porin [Herbaspirillum sp. SJZ130]TQK10035.1 putative porin [Herbaspirillum sp. SJZ106]
MKKSSLLLLAAGLTSGGAAFAQTNVTIYGIVDTSIHYLSNANANGNGVVRLDNGAIANSRIGFKGTEDLGGGLKAMFQLENGFSSDNGAMLQGGSLFGRQSWVGLQGGFGKIRMGRQNTPLFDLLADHFDPLTVGNYASNSWLPAAGTLIRTPNMVRYDNDFGPVSAAVSWSFGEKAGSVRTGSQFSSSLRYTAGAFAVGGGFQQTVSPDNSSYKDTVWNLSASYDFGSTKVFGGWFNIKDETGTTGAYMAADSDTTGWTTASTVKATAGNQRKDNGFFLGSSYKATSALTLTGAFYYDKSKNVSYEGLGNVGDGKRYAVVGWADYALSKRTQLYATIDYNKAKDAAVYELTNSASGKNSLTTVGMGIRHIF